MKRLLALAAAPLLFAAGCSSSSGTPTAAPTTTVTSTTPAGSPGAGTGTAPTTAPTTAAGTGSGRIPASGAATKSASTPRCHTGDLKLSLGEGDGAAGTTYTPLRFKNVSGHACTLTGFPGVHWVAGADEHRVNAPFARAETEAPSGTIKLAAGGAAHSMLATHDVGFYDAAQCKPVSVRGYRVYPPDETKSVFVPLATKTCSVNGINQGSVTAVAKGVAP
ncbi:DUF4232 domain-containing protein [Actinoplanes sp. KI2]|uniref:DUF4232 domain-containing protein n=1 Tax=Actinoplanes sp. KI2 TaxID=2983315 RepID=UPI0021D56D46|nr:DUF4232 domain-containing protein [Actinoplanes sp. KI2]MCU7730364.1 DUF4232 domain-containing protein [Actinoplanes sp. KI2]